MKANGFLCRSHVDAVCIPGDPRSMIMPRRPDRTLAEHSRIVDLKYSRLVDSRRFNSGERSRAVTLPMVTKKQREPRPPKTTTGTGTVPSRPPSNDHVFQVKKTFLLVSLLPFTPCKQLILCSSSNSDAI
ncbi:hypothetical protein B296_00038133 [Ensete ventricosum]|uniref:Uncharacterized protein n=1 Tax=Ensete ventricosum TaxID=4639 RepID=A0A426Z4T6_ENSVE|nr:hypothetical protein B296_00038133 [Ensete ventricosum]